MAGTTVCKRLLRPERLRRLPRQFSWIDQALVQRRLIDRCGAHSAALYLFLLTVADAQGLSYYGSTTLAARLRLSDAELDAARARLIELELLAWEAPLYQVLELPGDMPTPAGTSESAPIPIPPPASLAMPPARRAAQAQSIGELLANLERRRDRL